MAKHVRLAREALVLRDLRTKHFPTELFQEHAWAILLHAYANQGTPCRCGDPIGTDVSTAVTDRWCEYLVEAGLLAWDGPERKTVTMTALGVERMDAYLAEMQGIIDDLAESRKAAPTG